MNRLAATGVIFGFFVAVFSFPKSLELPQSIEAFNQVVLDPTCRVIVLFHNDDCSSCELIKVLLIAEAMGLEETIPAHIFVINLDEVPALEEVVNKKRIPSLRFYKKGKEGKEITWTERDPYDKIKNNVIHFLEDSRKC